MFEPVPSQSFSEREEEVLAFWKKEGIFSRSVEERQDCPQFTFYDGPPFATGLPHYGHIIAGTIKDVVPRYKTMKGFHVSRRFGWDCHGLPVENEIEKAFNLSGAASIEEFGIDRFNEECRKIVLRYSNEWRATVDRMARWVDFDRRWHTMDLTYMESVWWVFKQLFEKGLVHEGFKVMPFSAKLGTPLSNFEASENYKDVDDPSITVAFTLVDDPQTALLAWTTTPWTLVSNLAIGAGPEIEYVKIRHYEKDRRFILAKEQLESIFPDSESYEVIETLTAEQLDGLRYQPLFSYFADRAQEGAFRVLVDDFVTTGEGTGLVHMSPAFGEDDFLACQKAGIDIVNPVDGNGQFTQEVPEYQGLFVKDADKSIMKRLKESGNLITQGTIRHRYPFCWRSDTPLIYRAVNTWFVGVEQIKERVIASNEKIHWVPEHIKYGRFGKWLEGARDWAISRNRYWGTPIPLWRAEDGEVHAVGSIAELERLTGETITDLHRHHIDHLTFEKDGKTFRRIPEVFDCWFESGSMPYAQRHYPFENQKRFEETFPADFIAEGLDQTRGWFYTLNVLSTALFDQPAFKNVIVNGIVLAEDGAKMSKRLKNYPDPMEVVSKYGADAIRLYMLHSPVVRGDDLRFCERGVELVLRQIIIPWWNAYSFFITYARIAKWKAEPLKTKPQAVIDRWIISQVNKLAHDVETGMDGYDLSRAVEPFVGFIDQLTNWYIRRSRRRFWESDATQDRQEALATLYHVLLKLCKIAAPFVPYISDAMFRNLRHEDDPISVHLCDFPSADEEWRDHHLEGAMAAVQAVASLGHSLRKEHKVKVRQPLPTVHVASPDHTLREFIDEQRHLVEEELNVKQVTISDDETKFVTLRAKPNFRVLGKKVGKLMRQVQQKIESFDVETLHALLEGGNVGLEIDGQYIELEPEDVDVQREVLDGLIAANEGMLTVALDTSLSDELVEEALAREIVNKVNTMRRDLKLDVTDRIKLTIDSTAAVEQCYEAWEQYIRGEVLATEVSFKSCNGQEWDLNGEKAVLAIEKA